MIRKITYMRARFKRCNFCSLIKPMEGLKQNLEQYSDDQLRLLRIDADSTYVSHWNAGIITAVIAFYLGLLSYRVSLNPLLLEDYRSLRMLIGVVLAIVVVTSAMNLVIRNATGVKNTIDLILRERRNIF